MPEIIITGKMGFGLTEAEEQKFSDCIWIAWSMK
jgi:hypothetical protein